MANGGFVSIAKNLKQNILKNVLGIFLKKLRITLNWVLWQRGSFGLYK